MKGITMKRDAMSKEDSLKLFLSLLSLFLLASFLTACGGGGASGPIQNNQNVTGSVSTGTPEPASEPEPQPVSSESSRWVEGVFEPDSNFKSLCENPRDGFSEVTGEAFPDLPGSALDENDWLRSWVNDTYLWYNEVIDRDPSLFTTEQYFPLLRTEETTASGKDKDEFHFTVPTDEWEALSLTGSSSGYGATIAILSSSPPREAIVVYTEPGTSASSVNLSRGARILEVDGADLEFGNEVDTLNAGLFPETDGEMHQFRVLDPGASEPRDINLTSGPITSTPVLEVETLDTNTGKVGYILFNDHIATAEQGLVEAVEQLDAEGITDLVLDLRYNGGGFLAIASQMAYMIAGDTPTNGRTFEALRFNDKHPVFNPVTGQLNEPVPFYSSTLGFSISAGENLPSLDLTRVFVITTSNTCSASESIINGLRGIGVDVVLLGSTTCGKPFGFYATDNCGTTYFSIQFQAENDAGFGEFSDGFAPNNASSIGTVSVPGCFVSDDFSNPLGDTSEAMLAMALQYRDTGSCSTSSGKVQPDNQEQKATKVSPDAVVVKSLWLQNKTLP